MLVCPACRATLPESEIPAHCSGCKTALPKLGGVPCLIPSPDEWRSEWQDALAKFLQEEERSETALRDELKNPQLFASTRDRLFKLLQGRIRYRKGIEDLLKPLGKKTGSLALALLAQRPDLPNPSRYIENLFRDWAWGDPENAECLERVSATVPSDFKPMRMAVLGAGACRLAADLHRKFAPNKTWALDHSPVLLLAASRILGGEELELTEFVYRPTSKDAAVLDRACAPPENAPSGLQPLLADATDPPFADESLDCLVTPWFIDILPEDCRTLVPRILRPLRSGGRWIFFGPLTFGDRPPSQKYSPEEFREIVTACGMKIDSESYESLPYLQTPESGCRRFEKVLAFSAIKERSVPSAPKTDPRPEWIRNPKLPVPKLPQLAEALALGAGNVEILGLVDGRNSLSAIATIFAHRHGASSADVERDFRALFLGYLGGM